MALPFQQTGAANQSIYATSVASYLAQVVGWDSSLGLATDSEFYEKISRDSTCSGALDHLQKLIVGHDYFYEPSDDTPDGRRLADVVGDLTKQCQNLPATWWNMAAATWKGAAWERIRLAKKVLRIGDGEPRVWTVVEEVKDVDKRRFRLSRVPYAGAMATDTVSAAVSDGQGGWRPQPWRQPEGRNDGFTNSWHWEFHRGFAMDVLGPPSTWTPLDQCGPLEEWIQFVIDTSERGLSFGWGLGEDLLFNLFAKTKVMRSLLQGIDRWGQGFLIQYIKGLREGGADGYTPEAKIALAIAALRKYRSENVYAMDAEDKLELMDGPSTSIDACMKVIEYFDKENRIRILSAVQTTGGGEGGGFSQAKVEEGSSDANVAFLRSPLEECWTRSVARLLVVKNKRNLAEIGLPDWLSVPRLRLRGRKSADPERAALILKTACELKLPVLKSEAYSMLELTAPNQETKPEDILDWSQIEAKVAGAIAGQGQPPQHLNGGSPKPGEDLTKKLEEHAGANGAAATPIGEGHKSVAESPTAERAPNRLAGLSAA